LKLTDKQKKRIIADYIECQNYRETGRRNGVSDNTVRSIVKSSPAISQKLAQKKEENTESILAFMDSQKNKVCKLLGEYLDDLSNPDKRKSATVAQQATVLGILIDKYTQSGLKSLDKKPEPVIFNFKDADGN
jgi:hypothetical protein